MYLGPLRPGSSTLGVVVVHPETGALWVELPAEDGGVRTWSGSVWERGGKKLSASNSSEFYVFDGDDLLTAPAHRGGVINHSYDETGRLVGVVWPKGEVMKVAYDEEGHVDTLTGPGPNRWMLRWDGGLLARDPLGRTIEVDVEQRSDLRIVMVKDSLGHTVKTRYGKNAVGQWRVSGWQDPRGLDTWVKHRPGWVDLRDPAGRDWRIRLDDAEQIVGATAPDGHRWAWSRDDGGRVIRVDDPAGRTTFWGRDDAGRVVEVSRSGHVTRYRRDEGGWVNQIVLPTGSVTKIDRDDAGRISAVHDAAGNSIYFQRHENGWPSAVTGRGGQRWTIELDNLGRPSTFVDPVGRTTKLERDGAGHLTRWTDPERGLVRFDRTGDGRLSRISDEVGRVLGFIRNGTGQVVKIVRPDGSELALARNPVGDVVSIKVNDEQVDITRDPMGHVIGAGEVAWTRDIVGRVSSVRHPGVALQFSRDPSGHLRTVRSGSRVVTVQRDGAGWPTIWKDGASEVTVQRDSAGRVIVERVGDARVTVSRGVLGTADRVISAAGEWRWMRDASGRVLRIHGPEGVQVGFGRDELGRVSLVRYPSGALLRREYDGARVTETYADAGGQVVEVRELAFDAASEIVSSKNGKGDDWTWHRDPLGQVVSVEGADGTAWSWTLDTVQGPNGELNLFDENGQMMESRVGEGPPAWGVAGETMSVHRDALGRMDRISGEGGTLDLRFGSASELVGATVQASGERWSIQRDARGRVASVRQGAAVQDVVWHPDAVEGDVWDLLATVSADGTNKRVFGAEGGGAVWSGNKTAHTVSELVVNAAGMPAWSVDAQGAVSPIQTTPQGRSSAAVPGGFSGAGGWSPWLGGPILIGGGAVDPVSGERVDGARPWPWASRPAQQVAGGHDATDPAVWAPESPWSTPLVLLEALGVIPAVDTGAWWAPPADPVAFSWLPASLDGAAAPLGPSAHALPLGEMDPITAAFLQAVLPGGSPPAADLPVRVVLDGELVLPWLPPGVEVPGGKW